MAAPDPRRRFRGRHCCNLLPENRERRNQQHSHDPAEEKSGVLGAIW